MDRWRGRVSGLTIAMLAIVALAIGPAQHETTAALVVRAGDGSPLARVLLTADGRFTLRFRNSTYGSLVDEEFVVLADGHVRLTRLAADELAVLEEYYRTEAPARRSDPGASRTWWAVPAIPVEERALLMAATDLGERTLVVQGAAPLELWRLVDDAQPSVRIELDR
jgi:hypothetical protein